MNFYDFGNRKFVLCGDKMKKIEHSTQLLKHFLVKKNTQSQKNVFCTI